MKKIDILRNLVYEGACAKNLFLTEEVLERIKLELSVIEEKGYEDFFILHSRIIGVCNELKLIRTFGRSNSASSIVNYCLDITKLNPIVRNFQFERFIHPNRKALPEIQIDIPKGYHEVITTNLKLKYPEYFTYFIAITSDESSSYKDVFYNNINYKKHACGIIIVPFKLETSVFEFEGYSYYLSTKDKDDKLFNERVNLLELPYLNKLQLIVDKIGEQYHPYNIPTDDEKVFKYLSSRELNNIFQCNSQSMERILSEFKPSSINDLTIMNCLFRPPLIFLIDRMIESKMFVSSRIIFENKRLNELLDETYGLLIYQETFLQLSKELTGMSYAESYEWVRRVLFDKTRVVVDRFIDLFINDCLNQGTLNKKDSIILKSLLMEVLPTLFQKTHSVCYAMVSYWGAYYKTHFRKEFDDVFGEEFGFF